MNKALETALNAYLKLDPDIFQKLSGFEGQCVKLRVTDLGLTFFLLFKKESIKVLSTFHGEPSAIIESRSINLLSSALTSKMAKQVHIEGDVELGYEVYGLFKNIEIDWEEKLSHYTGDIIAHEVGNFARGFSKAVKNFRTSLQENVTEYVQYEIKWLPSRLEVEDFCEEVALVRQSVERLEAYLKQHGIFIE